MAETNDKSADSEASEVNLSGFNLKQIILSFTSNVEGEN